jgi:ferritin-like metal-binding protein YciE
MFEHSPDLAGRLVRSLDEAHATEMAMVRTLEQQLALAPPGSYHDALQAHLADTRKHAERVGNRLRALGGGADPIAFAASAARSAVAQTVALAKAPLDLARGDDGGERVLKDAKDAAAGEALEIATYVAIEQLARDAGDETTAELAASIRVEEEAMLDRILREIPRLADRSAGVAVTI